MEGKIDVVGVAEQKAGITVGQHITEALRLIGDPNRETSLKIIDYDDRIFKEVVETFNGAQEVLDSLGKMYAEEWEAVGVLSSYVDKNGKETGHKQGYIEHLAKTNILAEAYSAAQAKYLLAYKEIFETGIVTGRNKVDQIANSTKVSIRFGRSQSLYYFITEREAEKKKRLKNK